MIQWNKNQVWTQEIWIQIYLGAATLRNHSVLGNRSPFKLALAKRGIYWRLHKGSFQNPSIRTVAAELETVSSQITLSVSREAGRLCFSVHICCFMPPFSSLPFLLYCAHVCSSPGLNILSYFKCLIKTNLVFQCINSQFQRENLIGWT